MKNMKELKNALIIILFLFFSLFLFTKIFGPIPFSINSVVTNKNSFFTAEGQGEATGVPDTARVNIGITQQGNTVEETQERTNQAAQKIISEIKKLGIEEKDIKTTNYSVNPRQDFSNGSNRIVGYEVTQNLEITTKDTKKINSVIDAATASGSNLVGGVQFVFSPEKEKKLLKMAREEAVKNAKEKAESLASSAGISLGRIVDIQENTDGEPPELLMQREGLGAGPEDKTTTNIMPGENKVNIIVTLSYETR